jgi:hypothetical protein
MTLGIPAAAEIKIYGKCAAEPGRKLANLRVAKNLSQHPNMDLLADRGRRVSLEELDMGSESRAIACA